MPLYLLINLAVISLPLALSFDKKVHFYKKWKYFFPALFITASVFVAWDIGFTAIGAWGFNPEYHSDIYLINLPFEEVLFFITVPYASVFTYEVFKEYIQRDPLKVASKYISYILVIVGWFMGIMFLQRIYTSITFTLLALLIGYLEYKKFVHFGIFYLSYLVIIVPFLLVNGALTGLFTPEPIVWYNNNENLGIRIFTIPVEDVFYGMLLILTNVTFYEFFRQGKLNNERY